MFKPSFMSGFSVLFILVIECTEDQILIPAMGHNHTEVPTQPGLLPRSDLEPDV